jgi:hypothetical protein
MWRTSVTLNVCCVSFIHIHAPFGVVIAGTAGADCSDLTFCLDASIAADLLGHFQSTASFQHPILCPCGADIPVTQVLAPLPNLPLYLCLCFCDAFSQCHGSEDGVPMHPRMPCGCRKSGMIYGNCCLKRKYYLRETLTTYIPPPTFIENPTVVRQMQARPSFTPWPSTFII